jgi:hypothetical protein
MHDTIQLDRRSMLERALALVGATAAAEFSVPALAKSAAVAKPYLDVPLFTLLSAVADTIIPHTDTPGAVDVRVPALIDALLVNWASGPRRYELTQALTKIDQAALDKEGKSFVTLAHDDRERFLMVYEGTAMQLLPPSGDAKGIKALMSGPRYADPGYGKLKQLIILLYYASEPALTQELTYVHAPGEWKPSIPVTPDTRPAGGSLF